MKNNDKATTRTTINSTLLVWSTALVLKYTGIDLPQEVAIYLAPVGFGIFYRASLELSQRWPSVGRILFGINQNPFYEE